MRAGLPHRPRSQSAKPVIDGLSSRALAAIARLERSRSYLSPGDTAAAVRLWKEHTRRTERQLWADEDEDDPHWLCCGNPHHARELLAAVMQAMSPRNARELRQVVGRLDALLGDP
ncbi:hypothetical protein HG542_09470 [Streptomyces morookaense]|uniref:Uncharacterized protein n=1 Tax=Streptomyces morookaense TaxID=1970 RepID=A0A7Y7E718_STRMO|nr:hypothetical protein [Streptomyces morookaense]